MKKTPLLAATAIFSVLMISGIAHAKSNDTLPYTMTHPTTMATEAPAPAAPVMQGQMPMGKGMYMMPKLSEASQKMMNEAMEKSRIDSKPIFEQVMTKHQEIQAIVKAPVFDKAAFLQKHEEAQALHHKLGAARAEAMASVYEKMPAADRAQMGIGGGMMMRGKHHMGKGQMGECPMMGGAQEDGSPAMRNGHHMMGKK